jgi:hypothetical protein
MSLNVQVYDNGDHTCLVWLPADGKPIADCRGFTVRRVKKDKGETYLHGFVGFSDGDKLDPAAPWKFPVQRYMWWDYGVSPGDVVQYSVVPVLGPDKDHLELATAQASPLTAPMTITGQATPHVAAYFNKGIVSAQWVSRALDQVGTNANLNNLIGTTTAPGNALRNELSGLLRPQLLALLDEVKKSNGEIYAALYELNDPELKAALIALGKKCHLLLANGAFKPPTNDENADVRAELRGKVDLHDRLVTQGHFAHNKFVVACDASGAPQRVLSGSTNWTKTGLCTQANNGIIVDDASLAADFLAEWKLLLGAGNGYPPGLAAANSQAKTFSVDGGGITQWFAPTSAGQDLDYARKLINGAKEGILFLFFNPGVFVATDQPNKWTLLQNILARHHSDSPNYDGALYMRGVVNQEIANLTTESTGKPAGKATKHVAHDPSAPAPVTLFSRGDQPPQRIGYESMVPAKIKATFHDWLTEVMNQGVHIHSKVIVIDPFGEHPVVMTGSHNLGFKASSKNDDNLMIVEGNAPLAAAYAINIVAIYQTYRWNTYVEAHRQDPRVWHGLVDNPTWQDDYLTGDHLDEINFWLGTHPAANGQAVPPAPPSGPAHTVSATAPAPGRKPAKPHAPGKAPKPNKKPIKTAASRKATPTKRAAPTRKASPASKAATKRKTSAKRKAPVKRRAPATAKARKPRGR